MSQNLSRRGFLGVAGASALADPARAAAQAVGIKRGDLPEPPHQRSKKFTY